MDFDAAWVSRHDGGRALIPTLGPGMVFMLVLCAYVTSCVAA